MMASREGHAAISKMLVEAGAHLDNEDKARHFDNHILYVKYQRLVGQLLC